MLWLGHPARKKICLKTIWQLMVAFSVHRQKSDRSYQSRLTNLDRLDFWLWTQPMSVGGVGYSSSITWLRTVSACPV